MSEQYELSPMIGMNLIEQEEWFNTRIRGIEPTEQELPNVPPLRPHVSKSYLGPKEPNVISVYQFKLSGIWLRS